MKRRNQLSSKAAAAIAHVRKPFQERIDRLSGRLAGERFNQRFAERLERNLDAARTLKPRRHRIRHTR